MNISPQDLLKLLRMQKTIPNDPSTWPAEWTTIAYKDYEQSVKVSLDETLLASLEETHKEILKFIANRSSSYDFNNPLTAEEIFLLLSSASREKDKETKQRMYPSGGALYPLELYFVQQEDGLLPCGVYHFSQVNNILVRIKTLSKKNQAIFEEGHTYHKMTSYLVVTYTPKRNTPKYDLFGIKIALIEAGTLLQNISLLATSFGMKTRTLAGFNEIKVASLLELSNNEEFPLFLIAISK